MIQAEIITSYGSDVIWLLGISTRSLAMRLRDINRVKLMFEIVLITNLTRMGMCIISSLQDTEPF